MLLDGFYNLLLATFPEKLSHEETLEKQQKLAVLWVEDFSRDLFQEKFHKAFHGFCVYFEFLETLDNENNFVNDKNFFVSSSFGLFGVFSDSIEVEF